jgi:D-amino-acid oxidase
MWDGLYWKCLNERWYADKDPTVTDAIVVIGAGVIGLSTALACRAAFPAAASVTVVARDFELPTSAVSAGVWFPFLASDERINRFAEETYEKQLAWVAEVEGLLGGESQNVAACVRSGRPKAAPDNPIVTTDTWTMSEVAGQRFEEHIPSYVRGQRPLEASEFPHACWRAGLEWTTVVTQSQLYMPLLRRLCAARGVRLRQEEVGGAAAFVRAQPRGAWVVCCAGLGAVGLLGDTELRPVQGSILKVDVAGNRITGGRFLDSLSSPEAHEYAYVIPRMDCLVLGGTGVPDVWSREAPSPETVRGILERCDRLAPGLAAAARVLRAQTDLRPVRPRLAMGPRPELGPRWLDSYGYGGSGWTVHLGAAAETVRLLRAESARQRGAQAKL